MENVKEFIKVILEKIRYFFNLILDALWKPVLENEVKEEDRERIEKAKEFANKG